MEQFLESLFDKRGMGIPAVPKEMGPGGVIGAPDAKLWSGAGFGRKLRSSLGYPNDGTSFEVTDLGKLVVINASYTNLANGKKIQKTFAILFNDLTGSGRVYVTSTRWREFSTVDQAASYIKSYMGSEKSRTQ